MELEGRYIEDNKLRGYNARLIIRGSGARAPLGVANLVLGD